MADDAQQVADRRDPSEDPPFVDLIVGPGREPDNRSFGRLLERLRQHAGLSRADAAASLGFSSEYLRLIELGQRTPALGKMQSLLDAYGAEGVVGELMPGGDQPDLIVLDPFDPNEEPVIVEFKSRIREARRSSPSLLEAPSPRTNRAPNWPVRDTPPLDRAAELGAVVVLLTQAPDSAIRAVRELLETTMETDEGAG